MIWCKISDTDINTMDLRKKRPEKKRSIEMVRKDVLSQWFQINIDI